MSADEAFDNLMNKNAFAIPVAGRKSEAPAPDQPGREQAMRVAALFDDPPADYVPPGDLARDSERGVYYNHPTETDLEPVEVESVDVAHRHGARILGRDAEDDADYPPPGNQDGDGSDNALSTRLGGARRLRRFAYLPLSGMETFAADARDMLAGLAAVRPEQPSLAITSAARGEGRTELAIRLALALGRKVGYRVLLADCDVKKPNIATRLGLSSKYFTLIDVLRGSCPLAEALVMSEEDDLYVLPARATDRDGDEVLDARQVESLFEQLHSHFDLTIIDCGPAGNADALAVCRHAGATALAAYCGRGSARALRAAGRHLEAAGARVAGTLLTGG